MEMNILRVLIFLVILLRMRCSASDNIMCLTKKCLAAAAKQRELEQNQETTSTTESEFESRFADPAFEDPTTEIPTTKNPLHRTNFQSDQTQRINQFSKEILFSLSSAHQNDDTNLIVSPFSIWSVMLLVAEGASGQSYDQLKQALYLSNDSMENPLIYKNIEKLLSTNRSGIALSVNQAMFTHSKYHLQPEYINTLVTQYKANFLPVDFQKQDEAAKTVNDYLSNRTNGQVNNIVNPNDLSQTVLMLTSSILFEARWKFPFDSEQTLSQQFFRENGELISDVPMMRQRNEFRNVYIGHINATVVELPYDNRFSMLLIYPHASLNTVFDALRTFDIVSIFKPPLRSDIGMTITVPKFEINSKINVKSELQQMGVRDVFNPTDANLSKMFSNSTQRPYLSHVVHKARIQVNEAGTIATAVTVANFEDKSLGDEITFNRPFGYLIMDQLTDSILFAGQVKNPLKQ